MLQSESAAMSAFCVDFISTVEKNSVVWWFWRWSLMLQKQACLLCQADITTGHASLKWVTFIDNFPFDAWSLIWVFFPQLPVFVGQCCSWSSFILQVVLVARITLFEGVTSTAGVCVVVLFPCHCPPTAAHRELGHLF